MTSKVKGRKAQTPKPSRGGHTDKYGVSDMGETSPVVYSGQPLDTTGKLSGKKRGKKK